MIARQTIILLAFGALISGCGATGRQEDTMTKQTAFTAQDDRPPGGIAVSRAPQFVAFGFDDNGVAGTGDPDHPQGMQWALDMFAGRRNPDGTDVRASFYLTASYATGDPSGYGDNPAGSPTLVKRLWHRAFVDGHETGNHTFSHPHGTDEKGVAMTVDEWIADIKKCNDILSLPFDENESIEAPDPTKGAGIPPEAIVGFRTPFLEYTDNTFAAVQQMGFAYDCSIEDGIQPGRHGGMYYWPYQLDEGSFAHDLQMQWGLKGPLSPRPGLWELPVYAVTVPPDAECEKYGVAPGFRNRMKAAADYFDKEDGKITGFDYNMWVLFHMTRAEFVAVLKYSLDLRLAGNRAPFLFGMHSDMYADGYSEESEMRASPEERRQAVEEFVDYALAVKAVRMVPAKDVLAWMKSPAPLPQ